MKFLIVGNQSIFMYLISVSWLIVIIFIRFLVNENLLINRYHRHWNLVHCVFFFFESLHIGCNCNWMYHLVSKESVWKCALQTIWIFCFQGSCSKTEVYVEKRVVHVVNMEQFQHAYRNIGHNIYRVCRFVAVCVFCIPFI